MAIKIIDDTILQDIAVSIQSKDGGGKMEATEMAERIDAIPSATQIVDGTITEYIDFGVQSIRYNVFSNLASLTKVVIPNVSIISPSAFGYTSNLKYLECQSTTTIGDRAFQFSLLNDVDVYNFPECLSIGSESFGRMGSGTRKFYFPKLTNIGADAFRTTAGGIFHIVLKKQAALSSYMLSSFLKHTYYVPQRYFTWYTTATNWSAAYAAYPNSIKTIEDNIDYLVRLGYDREELLREEPEEAS